MAVCGVTEMSYRYYLVNRPPDIGCQPEGFIGREVWMPARPIPEADTWRALGWVEYDHKLSMSEIYKYELFPADRRGCALYKIWLLENKNIQDADSMVREYVNLPEGDFKKLLEMHDNYAYWVDFGGLRNEPK